LNVRFDAFKGAGVPTLLLTTKENCMLLFFGYLLWRFSIIVYEHCTWINIGHPA